MTRIVLVLIAMLTAAAPAWAQKINVKSATPSSGSQGTLSLDVVVAGSGFGAGAKVEFLLTGSENPGGIVVRNTRFVSSSQLVATIDIAETASISSFDVRVSLKGRSGKGTDLFRVVEKVAACEDGVTKLAYAPLDIEVWPRTQACGIGSGGALDCTFGDGGLATTDLAGASFESTIDMFVEPDGRLVVLATGRPVPGTTTALFNLLRFHEDGTIDPTFGVNGRASVEFTSKADKEIPSSMVRQPDGRILVGGHYYLNSAGQIQSVLARFLPNGTLDPSFGSGGRALVIVGSKTDGPLRHLALQADGKILAMAGGSSFRIARFMPNGAVDPSFGNGGMTTLPLVSPEGTVGTTGLVIQRVGTEEYIVFAGGTTALCQTAGGGAVVGRLRLDGTPDPNFGHAGSGIRVLRFPGYGAGFDGFALDAAGRILLAGWVYDAGALIRLTENGAVDESFGFGGAVLTRVTGPKGMNLGVLADAEGRIVTVGWHQSPDNSDFLVQRYLSDGTPDPTFGLNGSVATAFPNAAQPIEWAKAVAIQPNGRIVAAGRGGGSAPGGGWVALAGYSP